MALIVDTHDERTARGCQMSEVQSQRDLVVSLFSLNGRMLKSTDVHRLE